MIKLTMPDCMRSTDFKTFEMLSNILFMGVKKNIDEITSLKDVENCPDRMLPLLSECVGFDYLSETTYSANRLIIKNWWWLMKNKGTIPAIEVAASLGLIAYAESKGINTSGIQYNRAVDLLKDPISGEIYYRVLYQGSSNDTEQLGWIKMMVDFVRPAGFKVDYIPSEFTNAYIEAAARESISAFSLNYVVENQSALTDEVYNDNQSYFDSTTNNVVVNNSVTPSTFSNVGLGQEESSGLNGEERYTE